LMTFTKKNHLQNFLKQLPLLFSSKPTTSFCS
jgi:hypothetical protein